MIETVGLTKQYPSVTALDHLDVTVGDGVTGLVGANGAGKSTLIGMLATLVGPSSGEIRYGVQDARHVGPAVRARIGLLAHLMRP